MAIFLTENSKVIVQGMTGSEGMKHTTRMLASGTNIVGGVNPRKAGETVTIERPGHPGLRLRRRRDGRRPAPTSRCSSSRRPSPRRPCIEAVDAGMPLAIVITEGVPVHDTAEFRAYAEQQGHPDHRPQLPRPDQPRQVQRRHHPRRHHQGRAGSGWSRSRAR